MIQEHMLEDQKLMFNKCKQGKVAIIVFLILISLFTAGCGKTLPEKVPDLRDDVSEYVESNIAAEPKAGENDEAVFNLLKSGSISDKDYSKKYLKSAEEYVASIEKEPSTEAQRNPSTEVQKDPSTEAQRNPSASPSESSESDPQTGFDGKTHIDYETLAFVALAVKEAGGNPRDIGGVNLMDYFCNMDAVREKGLEAECYAIIAMKYCGEETETLFKYDEDVLNFMYSSDEYKGKVDEAMLRGLGLIAMSYYKTLPDVASGVDMTLNRLRELQKKDGGFGNCKSDATVCAGLAALSIDSYEFRKDKESENLLSSLISYMDKDGFRNTKDGKIDNEATVRALTVLNMYKYKVSDEKDFLVPEV